MCPDGSTFRELAHSGVGVTYLSEEGDKDETEMLGQKFKIAVSDNYYAELAGINRCLRSIPVTVPAIIHTDSQSSIDAIERALNKHRHSNTLKTAARPYMASIIRAIRIRAKHGGTSELRHIRSHTGNTDRISLGNEMADTRAKSAALDNKIEFGIGDISYTENELCYIVHTLEPEENDKEVWTPIHGNIRKDINMRRDRKHIET